MSGHAPPNQTAISSKFNHEFDRNTAMPRRRAGTQWLGLRDKRGIAAAIFAVSATVVIGMVGLGTEGGLWYLTRRNAQDAADPAAYAGAVRLSLIQAMLPPPNYDNAKAQAEAAAKDTATQNGFTDGTDRTIVTVTTPASPITPAGQSLSIDPNTAVEVVIRRTAPRLISGLFLLDDPQIAARGYAALTANGPACILAEAGGLIIGGKANISAPNCVLTSNSDITVNGSASRLTDGGTLSATGACRNCGNLGVTWRQYQAATPNPFESLDNVPMPTFSKCYSPTGSGLSTNQNGNATISSGTTVTLNLPPTAGEMICGGLTVNGTLILNAGTYYFYNSSLSIGGTVKSTLGGRVTLVFLGDKTNKIGLDIQASAAVDLTAPPTDATNPPYPFPGVLFFIDNPTRANGQGSNPQVTINGTSSVLLNGGMYFRNSDVTFNGSASVNTCSILVGYSVTMSGSSTPSLTACQGLGFQNLVPITRIVRLVE